MPDHNRRLLAALTDEMRRTLAAMHGDAGPVLDEFIEHVEDELSGPKMRAEELAQDDDEED